MAKKPCECCNSNVMSMGVKSIEQDGGHEGKPKYELKLYGGALILLRKMEKCDNPHFLVNYCPTCGRKLTKREKE